MRLSISEILSKAAAAKRKADRAKILQENDSVPLRTVLKYALDPNIKFLLPEGVPPYKESASHEGHGMLYSEARKLYLFIEGGNDRLTPLKRQMLFINMLEAVDKDDAKVLIAMKDKSLPHKTISKEIVEEAFPGLI